MAEPLTEYEKLRDLLRNVRERIGKLTLAPGLPMEVWSELCKLHSDLKDA